MCFISYNALERIESCEDGKDINKKEIPVNPSSKGTALGSKIANVVDVQIKHYRAGSNDDNTGYVSANFQTNSTKPSFCGYSMPNILFRKTLGWI